MQRNLAALVRERWSFLHTPDGFPKLPSHSPSSPLGQCLWCQRQGEGVSSKPLPTAASIHQFILLSPSSHLVFREFLVQALF